MALIPTQHEVEALARRHVPGGDAVKTWALAFALRPLAIRLIATTAFAVLALLIFASVGLANTNSNPAGYLVGWVLVILLAAPLQYLKKSHVVVLTDSALLVFVLETSVWKAFSLRPEGVCSFPLSALPSITTERKRTFTRLKILHPHRGVDLRLLHRAPRGAQAQVAELVAALRQPN